MRYFANVGGSTQETEIEKKVLASNPIMEVKYSFDDRTPAFTTWSPRVHYMYVFFFRKAIHYILR